VFCVTARSQCGAVLTEPVLTRGQHHRRTSGRRCNALEPRHELQGGAIIGRRPMPRSNGTTRTP